MTAFWAVVKDVVTWHQHIALRDDDLAPVAGRAVVLAWGWWDGHGSVHYGISVVKKAFSDFGGAIGIKKLHYLYLCNVFIFISK